MTMMLQFSDMTSSSKCFDAVSFLLSSLVTGKFHVKIITGSGVITIFFYKDWPEIQKSEIPPSEFCPISGDWGKLGKPNLARISLTKFYWMLQNARITAFTVSELLKENQQGGKITPPSLRLGLKNGAELKLPIHVII